MKEKLAQLKKDLANVEDRLEHCSWGSAEILADEQNDISGHVHYFINKLTTERIPLTEAQYDDNDYTIERARQT